MIFYFGQPVCKIIFFTSMCNLWSYKFNLLLENLLYKLCEFMTLISNMQTNIVPTYCFPRTQIIHHVVLTVHTCHKVIIILNCQWFQVNCITFACASIICSRNCVDIYKTSYLSPYFLMCTSFQNVDSFSSSFKVTVVTSLEFFKSVRAVCVNNVKFIIQ